MKEEDFTTTTTEDPAAKADQTSIASPTPRRRHPHQTTPSHQNPTSADGTGCLEIRAGSVLLIAPNTKPLLQLRARETDKGAGVCERGDPLLFIKQ